MHSKVLVGIVVVMVEGSKLAVYRHGVGKKIEGMGGHEGEVAS